MIYFDDRHINEFGLFLRPDHEHPGPETDEYAVTIPGMHGAHDMGSRIRPRRFNLPLGFFPEMTQREREKKIREFMSFLLDQYGKPRTFKLVFEYEPEKWYRVRYSGSLPLQRILTTAVFDLSLTAFDPFAYAPATYYDPDFVALYDTDTYYDDGVTEYKNQTHTPFKNARQYAGVFNYSHYATPFSFVIEGYVRNPKITNLTSGVSAKFNGVTVEADERLYFDSKLMTTWKVKASEDKWFWLTPYQMMRYPAEWDKLNHYNNMSGHFLELVSGDNTILFEGEQPNAQVNFRWEHRFL